MHCAACDDFHSPSDPCSTLMRLRSGLSGTLMFPPAEPFSPAGPFPQADVESARLPAAAGALEEGTRLGHFRVVRSLGTGAMGAVYLGEHEMLGSKVALKV